MDGELLCWGLQSTADSQQSLRHVSDALHNVELDVGAWGWSGSVLHQDNNLFSSFRNVLIHDVELFSSGCYRLSLVY